MCFGCLNRLAVDLEGAIRFATLWGVFKELFEVAARSIQWAQVQKRRSKR